MRTTDTLGWWLIVLTMASGCDGEPKGTGAASAAPATQTAATTVAVTTTSHAASDVTAMATAEPKVNPCDARGMSGSGTKADPCKYGTDVLTASYRGRIDDQGAVFRIRNPWSEEVTRLSAAAFYYDEAGKQLTIELDDKVHRAARLDHIKVKLSDTTELALGYTKEQLPDGVKTAELQILGFGWGEGDDAVAFESTRRFSAYRAINGGDGPTGIEVCDAYRSRLETCPKQFPDALAAMKKSLRGYNNASPATQDKLRDGLIRSCQEAYKRIDARCDPE